MKLDRNLQNQWLQKLANLYPASFEVGSVDMETKANLCYLSEHGLISMTEHDFNDVGYINHIRITHRGLDLLADDGGLSTILGTVTVKLHADTLRDLLETRIAESDLPNAEKNRLIQHIQNLPADALKAATTHLLKQALDHLPDAIPWLQKWLAV